MKKLPSESSSSELIQRTIYGTIAAVFTLAITIAGGIPFLALLLIALYIMVQEWERLVVLHRPIWQLLGLPYLCLPILCLYVLRDQPNGLELVLLLFAFVWATDIAGYAIGKPFGNYKLAPSLSPNKTIEGLLGGIIAAAAVGVVASQFGILHIDRGYAALLGVGIACLAQAGDIFESALKRQAGIKDSGSLIPGHGGLLDRVDGLLFATPCFTALYFFL